VILEAKDIHKSYEYDKDTLHVLKGVDIKVEKGEIVAIVGPSGAGKSTLLHILGGLDKPQDGRVVLDDKDIYALADKKLADFRAQNIGFIFQFYHLLPEFTALENIMMPALICNNTSKPAPFRKRALELIDLVGLKDRELSKPYQLSGGEQQRIAIARAMMNEPQIIFCDEPTGNLDSKNGQEIIDLMFRFNKENKQTFIIVTHDDSIADHSHRTVHMKDGLLLK
jgi:lipoprotein-releasing system ATP-binding protein